MIYPLGHLPKSQEGSRASNERETAPRKVFANMAHQYSSITLISLKALVDFTESRNVHGQTVGTLLERCYFVMLMERAPGRKNTFTGGSERVMGTERNVVRKERFENVVGNDVATSAANITL